MRTSHSIMPCAFAFLVACGSASSAPQQPQQTSAASSAPVGVPAPPLAYSKFTDPLFLAYSDQRNVFGRRTLARLWVSDAQADPPSNAQRARLQEAAEALENTERAIAALPNPCDARVDVAIERASATKNRLEQEYLVITEAGEERSAEAKRLDEQVHLLRDEIESLHEVAKLCPAQMFELPSP